MNDYSQFRADPPLTDDDFARIRASVMATIAKRNARPGWIFALRFAIAAAIVVIVSLVAFRPDRPIAPGGPGPSPARRPATPTPVAIAPLQVTPPLLPAKPHRHKHPEPVAIAAAAPDMSIQLETGNPDIRIIWIMNRRTP